jgi:POT family proton-dependent oligopeptide transporter
MEFYMNITAEKQFFGHPRGLSTLFFTEYWERFSFYGMRALLILYMVADPALGGLGFSTEKAALIYGYYLGAVYIAGLPGGFIADRFWGQRKAVFIGGIIIASGHAAMAFEGITMFYAGLGLIIIGTGLLKPNVTVMVGSLYSKEDPRRDGGFTIFYMGINIGAFLAPLMCGYLAQDPDFITTMNSFGFDISSGWHWAFALAAIGMVLGLIQYKSGGKYLGEIGLQPAGKTKENTAAVVEPFTKDDKSRLVVIVLLLVFVSVFFSAFEQAGSSLNLFADNNTNNTLLGFDFPSSWFQSLNALFIIIFGPIFAWMWVYLYKIKKEPTGATKFALGLLGVGLGFAVLYMAVLLFPGQKVSPIWLTLVYLFHTWGELCLSPVGLSLMTKLAPKQIVSSVMGLWFTAIGFGGGLVGGLVASLYDANAGQDFLFGLLTVYTLASALILAFLVKPIKKLLAKNKEEAQTA